MEIDDDKKVGPDEDAHAENIEIPPLDTLLAQQIMTFLKGLASHEVFPIVQTTQPLDNRLIDVFVTKLVGALGTDAFSCPLIGHVMTVI